MHDGPFVKSRETLETANYIIHLYTMKQGFYYSISEMHLVAIKLATNTSHSLKPINSELFGQECVFAPFGTLKFHYF